MADMKMFHVEIVRFKDKKVVKRMGPLPERQAERVDDGANINLNHEEYYTRLVEAKKKGVKRGR